MKTWKLPGYRVVNGFPTLLTDFSSKKLHMTLYFGIFMESYGEISRDLNDNGDLPLFIRRNVPPMNIIGIQLREYNAWSPKRL